MCRQQHGGPSCPPLEAYFPLSLGAAGLSVGFYRVAHWHIDWQTLIKIASKSAQEVFTKLHGYRFPSTRKYHVFLLWPLNSMYSLWHLHTPVYSFSVARNSDVHIRNWEACAFWITSVLNWQRQSFGRSSIDFLQR